MRLIEFKVQEFRQFTWSTNDDYIYNRKDKFVINHSIASMTKEIIIYRTSFNFEKDRLNRLLHNLN